MAFTKVHHFYSTRCSMTIATGVVLKSLKTKVKTNKLAVYSLRLDAGTIAQTVHPDLSLHRGLESRLKQRAEYREDDCKVRMYEKCRRISK